MSETLGVNVAIWDLGTVRRVGRLRASAQVEAHRDEEWAEVVRHKLARHLLHLGHPLGVEIDERDVDCRQTDADDSRFLVTITGVWAPSVRDVVLRGGPRDGERLQVRDPWRPLRMPNLGQSTAAWTEDLEPIALAPTASTYELAGWNETERHWIFDLT